MFSNEDYLAELLTEAGMVSPEEVEQARASLSGNETIVEHLLAHTGLSQESVAQTLAVNGGVPYIRLADIVIDAAVAASITDDVAKRYRVIPVEDDGLSLTVAISDPLNFEVLDSLPHVIGRDLHFVCSTHQDIRDHLRQFYNASETGSTPAGYSVSGGDAEAGAANEDAPIIKLVMQLLTEAFGL